MAPGKSYPAIIILEVRDTRDGAAAIGIEVSDIQIGADCKVYKEPQVSYSPLE